MKFRRRKSNKLTVALFKNYITFMLISVGIFLVAYLYLGWSLSDTFSKTSIPFVDIMEGKYDDFSEMNLEDLKKIGGYIEIINSNGNVIHRDGIYKSEHVQNHYTRDEILKEASLNSDEKYTVFLKTYDDVEGEQITILLRVPNNRVNLSINVLGVPYRAAKPFYDQYLKVVSVLFLLFVINVLIYSVYTAKKIKHPLKKIDNALTKVIDGDLTTKLDFDGEKEFEVIRDTLNYLTYKLRKSQDDNKKLEESKNRMLLDLSHDIKTPMTTIRGFSAALYDGMIEDEEKKQAYYKTIHKKAERVSGLIDDLFEFVKMDTVQNVIKVEEVDICEMLRQIVLEFYDELEERGFFLDVDIPENNIELKVDYKLIKRAFTNLLENAIKYNESNTEIRVYLKEEFNRVCIEICDNGVGIPSSIRDTLFDAFVRGDESRKSDGGSGLGLSIAKKVIENHGGEISLICNNPKYSTIFRIILYK
ncbi:MAG: ATP-binding protein [Clostridium sp.]